MGKWRIENRVCLNLFLYLCYITFLYKYFIKEKSIIIFNKIKWCGKKQRATWGIWSSGAKNPEKEKEKKKKNLMWEEKNLEKKRVYICNKPRKRKEKKKSSAV